MINGAHVCYGSGGSGGSGNKDDKNLAKALAHCTYLQVLLSGRDLYCAA